MQKAVIVWDASYRKDDAPVSYLNKMLESGWRVVSVTPFGVSSDSNSSGHGDYSYSKWIGMVLVIIESLPSSEPQANKESDSDL